VFALRAFLRNVQLCVMVHAEKILIVQEGRQGVVLALAEFVNLAFVEVLVLQEVITHVRVQAALALCAVFLVFVLEEPPAVELVAMILTVINHQQVCANIAPTKFALGFRISN